MVKTKFYILIRDEISQTYSGIPKHILDFIIIVKGSGYRFIGNVFFLYLKAIQVLFSLKEELQFFYYKLQNIYKKIIKK